MKSNALPTSGGFGALYKIATRINHSCNPNVQHEYDEDIESRTIFAAQDIKEGEELLLSYIRTHVMTRKERQEELSRVFKFDCLCSCCTLSPEEVK